MAPRFHLGFAAGGVAALCVLELCRARARAPQLGACNGSKINARFFASTTIITLNVSRARALASRFEGKVRVISGSNYTESPCALPKKREGCTLAHLRVLKFIAAHLADNRWHLVIEDDAVPSDELACSPQWAEHVASSVDGASAVNLGPSHPYPAYGELFRHPTTMLAQYIRYTAAPAGRIVLRGWNAWTHAYMITPSAAERVAAYVRPRMCTNHWDVVMGHGARWDSAMQFVARVYDKSAHYPPGTWRNYGIFGQSDDHPSTTQ